MSFEFYFSIVMYPKIMFFIVIFQLFKILVHCTKERMGLELALRTYLADFCSEFCTFGFGAVCSPQTLPRCLPTFFGLEHLHPQKF